MDLPPGRCQLVQDVDLLAPQDPDLELLHLIHVGVEQGLRGLEDELPPIGPGQPVVALPQTPSGLSSCVKSCMHASCQAKGASRP